VVADAIDAAPREALEVVVADVELGLVSMQTGAWVDAGVGRAAESGLDAVVVCPAQNLRGGPKGTRADQRTDESL
jgi:hypothetical protein